MKIKLTSNTFISYLVSTGFWINLLFVLFKSYISISHITNYISNKSSLTSPEILVIAINIIMIILMCVMAYLLFLIASDFKLKNPFQNPILKKLRMSLALAITIYLLNVFSSFVETKYDFYLQNGSNHFMNNDINYYVITLLLITFFYKKALSLQQENDLTI